jgi:Sigma-54, DNA binding domain
LLLCKFHLNGRQYVEEEQSRSSRQGNFCKVNGRMPRPQRYVFIKNMSNRGIPIARRTVAKYRTELNILPSNMRRKYIMARLVEQCPEYFCDIPELNAWMASTKMLKDRMCNVS